MRWREEMRRGREEEGEEVEDEMRRGRRREESEGQGEEGGEK